MHLAWATRVLAVMVGAVALIHFAGGDDPSPPSTPLFTPTTAAAPGFPSPALAHNEHQLRGLLAIAPAGAEIVITDARDAILLTGGPLKIERSLTLRGAGDRATLTTGGAFGALEVAPQATLHLANLELNDAAGPFAPAILNHGHLIAEDLIIRGGTSYRGPAAINSTGYLFAKQFRVEDHRTGVGPGALKLSGTSTLKEATFINNLGHLGGAIENRGTLDLVDAYFATNRADEAGAIRNLGELHIEGAAFWINQAVGADSFGGALVSSGELVITNATFMSNDATFASAIAIDSGTASLAHLSFGDNPSRGGSDLFVDATATLEVRNTLFAQRRDQFASVDLAPGATLVSLGGNIVPHPGPRWPRAQADPPDQLGVLSPLRTASHQGTGAGGWKRVIPLPEKHPGRAALPAQACLSALDQPLRRDQSGTPRDGSMPCDVGAHQSTPSASAQPTHP